MRLCMVLHGPYPDPRVAREASVAVEDGYTVEVVAMRRSGEPAREIIDGVRVIRLSVAHVHGAGIGRMIVEYLLFTALAAGVVGMRAIKRRYDIVQVHNPPDFLVVAAMVPRLFGSRVILDIHDRSPDMFKMRFPGRAGTVARVVLEHLERLATAFADSVVTVHEPYLRELVARGTPPKKVTVVMNSVDEKLLPSARRHTTSGLRVTYHGTVTPHYGVHLLLDAVAEAADQGLDVHVEIIGGGDSIPALKERVAALGLSDRVTIEGRFLPHKVVLERINGTSVGVVPNLPIPLNRFALSSKLFEYVAMGVPVISAALPTICEHFDESEVLFFRPGDATSLAAALMETAADPDGAAARAAKARLRYSAYSWQVNASRYRALLAGLSTERDRRTIRAAADRDEGSP
jgi:glycosyltransferase involved in cell wall biosynthesis